MAAMVARRWNWLGVAAVVACAGLWGAWMLAGQSALADLVVLAWFGGIGLAGAIGMQVRSVDDALRPSAAALVPLNICIVAVLGEVALRHAVGGHAGAAWLAALALVHGAAGATRVRRIAVSESFRRLLLVFAVVLADVAFGLTAGGVVLVAGWGAAAIGFAWCGRRTALEGDQALVRLGLGAHISLTLIRVLLSAPPRDLGSAQLVPLLSVVILVGSCLASGFLVGSRDRRLAMVLNAAGLTAVAYLTAQTLSGSALVTAWAFEALALSRLSATGRDGVARFGAVGFLALAATHALVIEAPPMALVDGARSLGTAAIALGAIAIAVSLAAVGSDRDARPWLLGGAAAALLYLGSVAIITVFQPAAGVAPDPPRAQRPAAGAGAAERLLEPRRRGQPDRRSASKPCAGPQRCARTVAADRGEGVPVRPLGAHIAVPRRVLHRARTAVAGRRIRLPAPAPAAAPGYAQRSPQPAVNAPGTARHRRP